MLILVQEPYVVRLIKHLLHRQKSSTLFQMSINIMSYQKVKAPQYKTLKNQNIKSAILAPIANDRRINGNS